MRRGPCAPNATRQPRRSGVALLTPVLPLVLYYALHVDAALAFIVSALYGVLVTRPRSAVQTLVAAAIRGVEDVAPAVLLFIGIGMLLTATKEPQFAQRWRRSSPAAGCAIRSRSSSFSGLLSPLVLYRGPLNPFGVGIAIFTVLLAAHAIAAGDPGRRRHGGRASAERLRSNQHRQRVGRQLHRRADRRDHAAVRLPYQVGRRDRGDASSLRRGAGAFRRARRSHAVQPRRARADALPRTLCAGMRPRTASASGTTATPLAQRRSQRVAARVAATTAFASVRLRDDPECERLLRANRTPRTSRDGVDAFSSSEGTDLDVGLRLEDCGGWIVGEWHDHAIVAASACRGDARGARRAQGVARVLAVGAQRTRAQRTTCSQRGLATPPAIRRRTITRCSKRSTATCASYVRAGGPAYDAGLRTGDIVNKLDGKYWWEYGTYQTQSRAYDGQPHAFEIERGGTDRSTCNSEHRSTPAKDSRMTTSIRSSRRIATRIDDELPRRAQSVGLRFRRSPPIRRTGDVRRCCERLVERMSEIGLDARVLETAGNPLAYGSGWTRPASRRC